MTTNSVMLMIQTMKFSRGNCLDSKVNTHSRPGVGVAIRVDDRQEVPIVSFSEVDSARVSSGEDLSRDVTNIINFAYLVWFLSKVWIMSKVTRDSPSQ